MLVNTIRFMELFERDEGYVIPPFEEWEKSESEGFINFMRPAIFEPDTDATTRKRLGLQQPIESGSVEMPIAHTMSRRRVEQKGILGYFGLSKQVYQEDYVSFTNGRHRSRFMQAMEVENFPIEVEIHQLDKMRQLCGAS